MSIECCGVSQISVRLAEICWKCALMCAAGNGEYVFWGALSSSSFFCYEVLLATIRAHTPEASA